MRMSTPSLLRGLALVLVLSLLSGCTLVKPWQRGRLSHPAMDMAPAQEDGFRSHANEVREGSIGGGGGLGGGCGCG